MALKTWLWNLGVAGAAVATAGCSSVVVVPGDTEGADTEGTDTTGILPTNPSATDSSETDPNDTDYDDTDYDTDSYYDTDYYNDTDYYDDAECDTDDDCKLGECVDAGMPWAYCEPLPIPQECLDAVPIELAWVRQGEGAGRVAGVAGRGDEPQQVVLTGADVDGDVAPVALAPVEADAVAQALPITPLETELVTGAEQVDLDGDTDLDLVVSLRDDAAMRVVPLLQQEDGTFVAGADVVFEGPGGPAKLRRFAGGGVDLLARLDSGLLFETSSLGDGTFSVPALSVWATDPIADFAVGQLDLVASDDVLASVLGEDGQSSLEASIDGGALPVGISGAADRDVFIDARLGHLITVDTSGEGLVQVQTAELGVDASPESVLVPRETAPLAAVVSDVNGDGSSDLVLLGEAGQVTVVFQVSTPQACTQEIDAGAALDVALIPGSGSERGVVLSGPDGVLSVRGG